MTSRISLITAVGGAALMLAVPAAWGKGQLDSSVGAPPDVFERAVAAQQRELSTPIVSPDAFDRAVATKLALQSQPITSPDAVDRAKAVQASQLSTQTPSPDVFERAVAAREETGGTRVFFDDRREWIDPASLPVTVSATDTGRTIEWPQIGAGFGIGLMLALGLMVAMRHARGRPLAHG